MLSDVSRFPAFFFQSPNMFSRCASFLNISQKQMERTFSSVERVVRIPVGDATIIGDLVRSASVSFVSPFVGDLILPVGITQNVLFDRTDHPQ